MIPTIKDLDVEGKRVLVRVDYNVTLDDDGEVVDDTRIRASLPTLQALFGAGARQLVLMTHVGRPKGAVVEALKTDRVAVRLMKLLGKTVQKVDDCVDVELPENVPVVMLENLRFHKEEKENDPEFARKLAEHGEAYVNDAFATCHRSHASMVGVTEHLPGAIGLLVEKELEHLDIDNLEKPVVAVLGGAKLETKLPLIQRILPKVDKVLLGGAMIFTFYKAQGLQTGSSLVDEGQLTMAQMLANNEKILLPSDVVVAPDEDHGSEAKTVLVQGMPAGMKGLDIGPESVEAFKQELSEAKTIVWNGPLGFVEKEPFDKATKAVMTYLATRTEEGAVTIVGGGDSISYVDKRGMAGKFSHVSTGGGASMQLLEGKPLPALQALER
ncbi:MAG: phosphoglycerate kinase [Candidatus Woesearchaeota archaeon]